MTVIQEIMAKVNDFRNEVICASVNYTIDKGLEKDVSEEFFLKKDFTIDEYLDFTKELDLEAESCGYIDGIIWLNDSTWLERDYNNACWIRLKQPIIPDELLKAVDTERLTEEEFTKIAHAAEDGEDIVHLRGKLYKSKKDLTEDPCTQECAIFNMCRDITDNPCYGLNHFVEVKTTETLAIALEKRIETGKYEVKPSLDKSYLNFSAVKVGDNLYHTCSVLRGCLTISALQQYKVEKIYDLIGGMREVVANCLTGNTVNVFFKEEMSWGVDAFENVFYTTREELDLNRKENGK